MGFLDGFKVTFRKLFEERLTKDYVKDQGGKRVKPIRLHGRHVLNRYEDGMEKCIGCELCAGVCPARCIYVRGADNPPEDPGLARRALRLHLRDQLPALHPLRPVRGGVPHRGDHRDEAVRVQLQQPPGRHLHQGRAAGRRRRQAAAAPLGGLDGRRRGRAPHLGLGAGHVARRERLPTRVGSPGRASWASASARRRRASRCRRARPTPARPTSILSHPGEPGGHPVDTPIEDLGHVGEATEAGEATRDHGRATTRRGPQ